MRQLSTDRDLNIFEKLDALSLKAILAAEEESRRSGHKMLDTEQLLLGVMISNPGGKAVQALENLGLKQQDLRKQISEILGSGKEFVGVERPFTERMNKVLEHAWQAAQSKGKESIAPEDLLLGICDVYEGVTQRVLTDAQISAEKLREEIGKLN